ncbi:geranylgeranylglycerol-phosphate geranylgeranyltransferase [Ichthyenterobacterium sp. W332]|uniref:Geranylgeranylglycerol-phosphate geranylgeranyltransferase n=1 Tax=Microcosmobacter mediterraneus TaxID=3075607 RepID=A0ABU2YHH5_9FLAO|nr:geranylgeranylglycerol-phosphate geranylgeranyltransferase [Ichthyenterobacterium sp. W332]MDT0557618.1 geranylgeranylglycerol-phosphate geranylgeranyltransferase [Ichthyenterobacterium sp. W332]
MPFLLNLLNLIRWKNLVLIAVTQYLIKYALLQPFEVSLYLNHYGFALLVVSSLCIAAAGYIINDLQDVTSDQINKPDRVIINMSISESFAFKLYVGFNVLGVGLGFVLCHMIGKPGFFVIFFIISALLYLYSSFLQYHPVIGNLVIALVVAFSILIVGVFELIPTITDSNRTTPFFFFNILKDYAVFAFMITLLRELTKDIEDVDGDHNAGMNTLPIAIGRERANWVTFIVSLIPLGATIYYVIANLYKQEWLVIYFLATIIAPLIYVSIKLFVAETKAHYRHLSLVIKYILIAGILSLALYPLIIS